MREGSTAPNGKSRIRSMKEMDFLKMQYSEHLVAEQRHAAMPFCFREITQGVNQRD